MKRSGFFSNLVYALRKRLGWCPEPPKLKNNKLFDLEDASFVHIDKPKMGLTNYSAIMLGYLCAIYFLVVGLLDFYLTIPSLFCTFVFLVLMVPFHYCWKNTVYELTNSQLRIRSGFYKKSMDLLSINSVKVDREYSPMNINIPAVKYRDRVWLEFTSEVELESDNIRKVRKFDRIMITPDDPDVFIKELQKRVPHLVEEQLKVIREKYETKGAS